MHSLLQRWVRAMRLACVLALVLTLAGCDNIEWGGSSISITKPVYERQFASEKAPVDTTPAEPTIVLPSGPVLFHVERLDATGSSRIEPVLELNGAELRSIGSAAVTTAEEYIERFNGRYFSSGSRFILQRGLERSGSIVVSDVVADTMSICPRPIAEGQLELIPSAGSGVEFVAWTAERGQRGVALPPAQYRAEMPEMGAVLVSRLLRESGESRRWRVGNPEDLEPVLLGQGSRGFAATYTRLDSLAIGSPADSAAAAFIIADYEPTRGYIPLFHDIAWYGSGSKRALRWVDALRLNGGEPEWLLRAYGDLTSWYEVVGVRDGEREFVWSSRQPACEVVGQESEQ